MKKILATLILSIGLTPAWADWVYLGKSESYKLFVRPGFIKNGKTIKGWFIYDRLPDSSDAVPSIIELNESDCNKAQLRILQITHYDKEMGRGRILFSTEVPQAWRHPIPGTFEEGIFKTLCNLQ